MLVLEVGDIFWGPDPEGLGGEYNPPPEREDGPGRTNQDLTSEVEELKKGGQGHGPAIGGVESSARGI